MKKIIPLLLLVFVILLGGCNKENSSSTNTNPNGKQNETESPDFVTFANGDFPSGWKTYTWEIDNKKGYKDNYSLRSANYPTALVFANKTMKFPGFVEFYSCGENIEFFIDDNKAQSISSLLDGGWEKRVYTLDTGRHQLKWQTEGVYKYIDNIKFYTSE